MMPRSLITLGTSVLFMLPGGLRAQHDEHAHGERPAGNLRLGSVTFPNSGARAAQPDFLRGLALLHSFHYPEAARAFQAAERADPSFALPYWFEAFTYSHLLWGEDDPSAARAALARLAPTRDARLVRARTPRERDYGAAIEAFFADTTVEARSLAFADSMRSLTSRYADDLEAAAFASLALMLALDGDAYPPNDVAARKAQMIDLAERVFAASPNHPGAAHYLIHVSDLDPSFTARSLPAARMYARIAPDASHALHMPSHVFLRLGLWDEVASSNERSWAASRREMARDHLSGAELDSHSLGFLMYGYLESGRWRAARALIDSARRVIGRADVDAASHVDARYAVAELSFLYAAETGRWDVAVMPPAAVAPARNPREQSFMREAEYARSVVAGKRGDTATLAHGAAVFRALADSTKRADFLAAQLEGLLAEARGDHARARERFARAAAQEDGRPVVGPPAFLLSRELLGASYLSAGRPDSAALEFERALATQPNRTASLLGLARARAAAGERGRAADAYATLLANWRRADADLATVAEIRRGAAAR
jgi:tetratricopeptide (TPR) repeat protein